MGANNGGSTCHVHRKTGQTVLVDRLKVPEWDQVHTNLAMRLDRSGSGDGGTRGVTIADVTYETATGLGHWPALTDDMQDDDLVEIVGGQWAGTVWRIVKAVMADQKTARRLPIEETPRPEEWA